MMNFKDLLEKYKNGTANEEERCLVEEEIEKNELINDFLNDQFGELAELPSIQGGDLQEVKKIRKAVNRRLWAMVLAVAAILAAGAAFIQYVALPAYDSQFYDPLAAVEGVPDLRVPTEENKNYYDTFSPLRLSAQTFTQLHCPGWLLYDADAEQSGLGSYDVHFSSSHSMDGQRDFNCRITKGEQEQGLDLQWFFKLPVSNAFYDRGPLTTVYIDENGGEHYEQQENSRSLYREGLLELPESAYISAYITFPKDISVEELLALEESWDDCSVSWAAVRTDEGRFYEPFGFSMNGGGYVIEPTEEFEEQFPYFCRYSLKNSELDEATTYEEHFKSMIRYMTYQDDFLEAFCDVNGFSNEDLYEEALAYVEEKDIAVYGAYVEGDKEAMIALEQSSDCHSFMIDQVKVSRFS